MVPWSISGRERWKNVFPEEPVDFQECVSIPTQLNSPELFPQLNHQ